MNTVTSPQHIAQWHAMFCACQQKLVNYLAGKTGNIEDARDLAQETWLRVAEQINAMQDKGEFSPEYARAYLYTTANNLIIDRFRRNKLHDDVMHDYVELSAATTYDVADKVLYGQAVDAVENTIGQFPERMRQAFIAHRMHGEKHISIARDLGVSVNTIERDIMQADACLEDTLHRWRGSSREEQQQSRTSGTSRRRTLGSLLGIAVIAGTGLPAWYMWQHRLLWEMSLASGTNEFIDQLLPDGSQIKLNARSELTVQYFAHQRSVALRQGAAFFSVVRDEHRPYVVEVGDIRVTVLGTSFGVERTSDAIFVQVESGIVRVENRQGTHHLSLEKGQQVRIPINDPARTQWEQAANPMPAAWRYKELVFDTETLSHVVERLRSYTDFDIQVVGRAGQVVLSGQLRTDQSWQWLQALPQVAQVRLQALPGRGLRIVPL